jgi:hypothetical protein
MYLREFVGFVNLPKNICVQFPVKFWYKSYRNAAMGNASTWFAGQNS